LINPIQLLFPRGSWGDFRYDYHRKIKHTYLVITRKKIIVDLVMDIYIIFSL